MPDKQLNFIAASFAKEQYSGVLGLPRPSTQLSAGRGC